MKYYCILDILLSLCKSGLEEDETKLKPAHLSYYNSTIKYNNSVLQSLTQQLNIWL